MSRVVTWFCIMIIGTFFLWHVMYPDNGDPRNMQYVGWKLHLVPMNSHRALSIMTHDSNSERLVLGMTKPELEHRFGYVLTTAQTDSYLRDYCAGSRAGNDLLFLNNSNYMVVMQNGRASELVLCKG